MHAITGHLYFDCGTPSENISLAGLMYRSMHCWNFSGCRLEVWSGETVEEQTSQISMRYIRAGKKKSKQRNWP